MNRIASKWTPELRALVDKRIAEGLPVSVIAKRCGVSRSSIHRRVT